MKICYEVLKHKFNVWLDEMCKIYKNSPLKSNKNKIFDEQ